MNCIRAAATGASLALLAALAACGDRIENTGTPQAPQANVEINRQGMDGAKDADAAIGVANSGAPDGNVHSLGAKGGTSVMDPDVLIAEQVKAALASSPDFGTSSKVDVHAEDGDVTLRGRAPDPDAKERAEAIARSIPRVKSVNNELTLG
jgi:osmotically-inducible protein OsmY